MGRMTWEEETREIELGMKELREHLEMVAQMAKNIDKLLEKRKRETELQNSQKERV